MRPRKGGPQVIATHPPFEGELIAEVRDVISGELESFTIRVPENDYRGRPSYVDVLLYPRHGWVLERKTL